MSSKLKKRKSYKKTHTRSNNKSKKLQYGGYSSSSDGIPSYIKPINKTLRNKTKNYYIQAQIVESLPDLLLKIKELHIKVDTLHKHEGIIQNPSQNRLAISTEENIKQFKKIINILPGIMQILPKVDKMLQAIFKDAEAYIKKRDELFAKTGTPSNYALDQFWKRWLKQNKKKQQSIKSGSNKSIISIKRNNKKQTTTSKK